MINGTIIIHSIFLAHNKDQKLAHQYIDVPLSTYSMQIQE